MTETVEPRTRIEQEVVAFRVADQDFCFDIMSVREIRGWTATTILPHAQSYVKGVINLRGSVVPVVDLSARLGLGVTDPGPRHVIIITVVQSQTIGILAEVVSDIITVQDEDIQPVPDIVSDTVKSFISGVVIVNGQMIRKLDLSRVLPAETVDF